jgi:hypothetical protein
MTPIKWVYTGALVSKEEADGDAEFVPVLTLTDLEAWLHGEHDEASDAGKYEAASFMTYMLTQVQAWKEKP